MIKIPIPNISPQQYWPPHTVLSSQPRLIRMGSHLLAIRVYFYMIAMYIIHARENPAIDVMNQSLCSPQLEKQSTVDGLPRPKASLRDRRHVEATDVDDAWRVPGTCAPQSSSRPCPFTKSSYTSIDLAYKNIVVVIYRYLYRR